MFFTYYIVWKEAYLGKEYVFLNPLKILNMFHILWWDEMIAWSKKNEAWPKSVDWQRLLATRADQVRLTEFDNATMIQLCPACIS